MDSTCIGRRVSYFLTSTFVQGIAFQDEIWSIDLPIHAIMNINNPSQLQLFLFFLLLCAFGLGLCFTRFLVAALHFPLFVLDAFGP